ncbi:hypothetical protein EB061_10060 [bacterium]|nr:hypothetical protein [bacterium]
MKQTFRAFFLQSKSPGVIALLALPLATIVAILGVSCSPSGSTSATSGSRIGCVSLGYFVDESSCVSTTGKACEMGTFVALAGSKPLVCWKAKPTVSTDTTTSTTGKFVTSTGVAEAEKRGDPGEDAVLPPVSACENTLHRWAVGDWTPKLCNGKVRSRTRTVSCPGPCSCNFPSSVKPATTSSCVPDLYRSRHSSASCEDLDGEVHVTPAGDKICRFSGASCPARWLPYAPDGTAWTTTFLTTVRDYTDCRGGYRVVETGFHSFGPVAVEEKGYCAARNCFKCIKNEIARARVALIGCY